MANKITYADYEFLDSNLIDLQFITEVSPIGERLSADQMTFEVEYVVQAVNDLQSLTDLLQSLTDQLQAYTGQSTQGLENYIYGNPVRYYKDNVLRGKYFIKQIRQVGTHRYRFECISAVGLLIKISHKGGLYEPHEVGGVTVNYTAGEIIQDIFSSIGYVEGTDYTIANNVKNCAIFGHLPFASCRDNLQQVLFATGANVFKDSNGNIEIKYNEVPSPTVIPDSRLYIGGSVEYLTPATNVNVTEHIFYALDDDTEVTLFDNTDGTGTAFEKLIKFNNPCHDLDFGTLTEIESGVNYAIISGTGILTGKEYTHTRRILSLPTTAEGETNEVDVENATLVSNANSSNVAQRVAGYYGVAKEVSYGILVDGEKCGDYVQFTNPFGTVQNGVIRLMNNVVSSITKSNAVIATNFTPSHFGNNYTDFVLLTSGTTWTATKSGTLRFVLSSGGTGGNGGYGGENGHTGIGIYGDSSDGKGGAGGQGGTGGLGGKVNVIDVAVVQGTTYTFSLGTGGSGGNNGSAGADGTASTITINGTTYTSADGYVPERGYVNTLTGDVYNKQGGSGTAGAKGGDGHGWQVSGENGGDVTYNGITYTGGLGLEARASWAEDLGGNGGSGAAVGTNGINATNVMQAPNGAVPIARSETPSYGGGGYGGHGGGGGGGGAGRGEDWGEAGGYGGAGGQGSNGGQGYILIYL